VKGYLFSLSVHILKVYVAPVPSWLADVINFISNTPGFNKAGYSGDATKGYQIDIGFPDPVFTALFSEAGGILHKLAKKKTNKQKQKKNFFNNHNNTPHFIWSPAPSPHTRWHT
jgi:hypothetical protein